MSKVLITIMYLTKNNIEIKNRQSEDMQQLLNMRVQGQTSKVTHTIKNTIGL